MKTLSIIITQILLTSVFCLANTSDDYKYIWAINGLNLREAPNASSKIIEKLPFGDSLRIIETTEIKYTNLLIKKTEPEKHPIYLKSNWVKVKVNGKEGYLIDGYLLDLPCPSQKEQVSKYLERMSNRFSSSTLDAKFPLRFGTTHFNTHQIKFPNGRRINFEKTNVEKKKDSIETECDYGSEEVRYFKGFSTQEILVFLNPFYGTEIKKDFEIKVRRNWKEMIWMTDGGMQEIELTNFKDDVIVFYYKISC